MCVECAHTSLVPMEWGVWVQNLSRASPYRFGEVIHPGNVQDGRHFDSTY